LHKDPFLNGWEESYRLPRQSPTLSARSSSHSTAVVQLLGAIEPYRFAAVGEPSTGLPNISPETIISTRRFCCRPAAMLLSATGLVLPKPCAVTIPEFRPCETR